MPKNKQDLRYLLSGLKVWGVVAVLAALVITGFYGFQGYRYWTAWSGEKSMSKEVQQINTKLSLEIPEVASTESNRERQEQRLKDMQSSYFQSSVGNIMKTVSATARKTNVELSSLSAGAVRHEHYHRSVVAGVRLVVAARCVRELPHLLAVVPHHEYVLVATSLGFEHDPQVTLVIAATGCGDEREQQGEGHSEQATPFTL